MAIIVMLMQHQLQMQERQSQEQERKRYKEERRRKQERADQIRRDECRDKYQEKLLQSSRQNQTKDAQPHGDYSQVSRYSDSQTEHNSYQRLCQCQCYPYGS